MPRSAAFVRIKGEVLAVLAEIPHGRVTTFGAIGSHLDVMARHVAYILAMLDDREREAAAWHRVVGEGGVMPRSKHARAAEQAARLEAEGVRVEGGRVADLDAVLWRPGGGAS